MWQVCSQKDAVFKKGHLDNKKMKIKLRRDCENETAPPVRSSFGVWSEVSGGAFLHKSLHVKAVGCFRRGAPSLMFDRILNPTLPEEKV